MQILKNHFGYWEETPGWNAECVIVWNKFGERSGSECADLSNLGNVWGL